MAEAKTREQLEREWWDAWWAEDYSWDGLAKKAWVGWVVDTADQSIHEADDAAVKAAPEGRFRQATLQDYWRDQAGDLIAAPDGKRFTRVHLPPRWRDGTPTAKAEWTDDALDPILAPRLIAGAETRGVFELFDWKVVGADRRTQLQGAILLRAPTHPQGRSSPVHLQGWRACFAGNVDFNQQVFGPGARFNGATFSGNAGFDSATFSGDAGFGSATFSGNARFDSATFSGNAGFDFVIFNKDAWFTRQGEAADRTPVSFAKLASFDSAVFRAPARFGAARFGGRMQFDTASFEAAADFSQIELPKTETDWRGAFDGVLFQRALDLRGVDPKTVSMIAGATLDRDVLLDRLDERREAGAHRQALRLACKARDREDALKALESGALKLKQAMHAANDIAREQRFYRLELRARRKQKGTAGTEKLFSLLYAGASKYGASIGWPFLWLGGVIVGFAALYLAIEGQARTPEPRAVFESLRYSLSRVIPLGTWDESDDPLRVKLAEAPAAGQGAEADKAVVDRGCTFRERLMAMEGCRPDLQGAWLEAYRLGLSALATFQTVIAAALYFLLALAVRRKFQIS